MINKILEMLNNNKEISAWTLSESLNSSKELFYIKDRLDMNRRADTHEFKVKVYVDFEDGGEKYKGHASIEFGASTSPEEAQNKINDAIFSAKFVKNKWYDLPANTENDYVKNTKFNNLDELTKLGGEIHKALFKDYGTKSKVNSCEVFAIEGSRRVITSKGTDVEYPYSEFTFEIVTDCDTGKEPVEIFNGYYLTHIDIARIEEIVHKQLKETEGRSEAVRNEKLENQRVIISGDAVEELLSYYLAHASDSRIYSGTSLAKHGEIFGSADAVQKLNIRINPTLACSIDASPVDSEGKILNNYILFDDSKVANIQTSARFSHYLGVPNIGSASTFEVEGGELPLSDFMRGDYIEILAFSSFIVEPSTGDFGGEFRLAKVVKNGTESYITGGSISENIMKIGDRMRFSKELAERRRSIAPKAIIIDGITVAGE